MARSEARVSVDVWAEGSDFKNLSPDAQWLYFFLLSQHDLAHTGVLALRERRWSRAAAGLTAESIRGRLNELDAARYVVIDDDTEELLVRSLIRRDKIYRQPNVLRAAADQVALIASDRIRRALSVELSRIVGEPMPEASAAILAEMCASLPPVSAGGEGSGNPSLDPSVEGSGNHARPTPGVRGVVTASSTASPFPVPRSPDPVPRDDAVASSTRADEPRHDDDDHTGTGGKPKTNAGSRLPDDFEPTADLIEWARDKAPSVGRADHEAFCDYWRAQPGAKGRKADWPATWRNWMRREDERRGGHGARASPAAPRQSTTDLKVAAGIALAEKYDALDAKGITPR